MELRFTKMHGLGNDFIIVEDLDVAIELDSAQVIALCDRNRGIGADGIMLVRPAEFAEADFSWWFRNADGTIAEMCGNGIRCFAKYVADHGLVDSDATSVTIETLAGVRSVDLFRTPDGLVSQVKVDMGVPILEPGRIPTLMRGDSDTSPVVETVLDVAGESVNVSCVSMGNPHAVTFVTEVATAPVSNRGPAIETHASFPNKTNVEFVQVIDRGHIGLRVWERGCGETLACGTGACAAVVASVLAGRTDERVDVDLPGGTLRIEWNDRDRVFMSGPATEVFTGIVDI